MSPFQQLQIELFSPKNADFHQFLLYHPKIKSFQKIDNNFYINLKNQNKQEYRAFLKGVKEIFRIKQLKEIKNCQARCRDGTPCLNEAKHGNYCWKHKYLKKSLSKITLKPFP